MTDVLPIEGSFVNVTLEPQELALRSRKDNGTSPRPPAVLTPRVVRLRFEVRDQVVTELRAELVLDRASYARATAEGYFGLTDAHLGSAAEEPDCTPAEEIRLSVRADLDRVGPRQFRGLDLVHDRGDLLEAICTITGNVPASAFGELETWSRTAAEGA